MVTSWIRSEADPLRKVVVSPPLADYGEVDLRRHNWEAMPNLDKATREHAAFVDAIRAEGVEVHLLAGDVDHPIHIYPREAAIVTPGGAWISRFGLESRRGEEARVEALLGELGVPVLGRTRGPGTFEGGGDCFLVKGIAFVGRTARTDDSGARQVGVHLLREGYEVRIVPVDLSFHLLAPVGVVADRTLLVDERWQDSPYFRDFERIPVPAAEDGGGNVLVLGPRKVIIHDGYPTTIDRLRSAGVDVIPLDLTELKKAGGGPECLTLPIRRR